jgi:serine phosphatase RsbU (regulator of sigma subunit)
MQATPAVMVFFNIIALTVGTTALIMTLAGHYRLAANAACIFFFAGLTAFTIFRMDYFFKFGVNPGMILFILALAFASFFADRKVFIVLAVPMVLFHLAVIVLGAYKVSAPLAPQFLSYSVNSSITLTGLILFFYLSSNVANRAMFKAENEIQKNRNLAHTLEEKVAARTQDLALAMRELESSNAELTATKNSLWGEMRIATKLQNLLIPPVPSVDGYDLASYIKPAAEVGGDYYDVINQKDHDWIAIGDVSGHGVPAGLVMMMIHTSLRTALALEESITPSKALKRINSVVAENISKIDHSKYMTITLLKHCSNGRFFHAGLHLPILIYRHLSDSIEVIETHGTWIGLNFDIGSDFIDSEFTLEKNDIMLLYTDGLTESWITHGTGGMKEAALHFFGQDTLSSILYEEKNNSASAIRQRIINELKIYEQKDDVTFIVLKRLS